MEDKYNKKNDKHNKLGFSLKFKNGYTFIFLSIALFLSITVLVSREIIIFRFLSLILVFILSGLGFAKFFRKELHYDDLLGYLTNSLILGILINIVVLQVIGLLGVEYTNETLLCYFLATIGVNFLLLVLLKENKKLVITKLNWKTSLIDIIALLIIILLYYFLVQICLENYTHSWDSFTFWGVDSKYLFERRMLRNPGFDLLSEVKNSSLYTSIFFLVYVFFGGIYEQFSSLITLLFSLLAFLLIFNRAKRTESIPKKAMTYTSFIVILISFLLLQNNIVTQYADVFCAFLVLLFSIILLDSQPSIKDYSRRLFLLLLLCLLLYLTKPMYWSVSVLLFCIFLVYDIIYLKKSLIYVFRDKRTIVAFILVFVYLLVVKQYLSDFIIVRELISPIKEIYSVGSYVKYAYDLFRHVSETTPLIMILYGSSFCLLFFNDSKNVKLSFSLLIFVFVTLLPVGFFIITYRQDFGSQSLLRYMSLGYFVIPLIFHNIEYKVKRKSNDVLSVGVMLVVSVYLAVLVYSLYGLNFSLDINEGTYRVPLRGYYEIAESAKEFAKDSNRIILVDSLDEDPVKLTNMDVPGIFLRYYLAEYSVGIQYSLRIEEFETYLRDFVVPDYLLLFEYDGYFYGCNELLLEGKSYLVPYHSGNSLFENDKCFVDSEDIIPL